MGALPVERLAGMSELDVSATDEWAYPPGTILNEVMGGWRYPVVEGELGEGVPLEYPKVWRLAQQRTDRPVKIGTVSAQVAVSCTPLQTDHYKGDKHQAMWDMATAFNKELRALAAAGCKVIQIEEPCLHGTGGVAQEIPFEVFIEAFNREVKGLRAKTEVWCHTCWGNPFAQRLQNNPSYAPTAHLLAQLDADVITIEAAENNGADIESVAKAISTDKKLCIGVLSHRSLQVELPDDIAALIRKALAHIAPERLLLSSDCGFGRQGMSRTHAYYKMIAMVRGANIVKRELGLPETDIPAGNERLAL